MLSKPKISIISPSKNTGRFAKETIESILAQTYTNWEHIVVDGVSTDETLDVIRQYPHIRLVSEADSGPDEALRKGLVMARGEYILFCPISDGYLDKDWFKKCVDILDNHLEIALVWGFPQYMSEEGVLGRIAYDHFFDEHPLQGKDFIYYWLKTHFCFPEGNFCIRRKIVGDCVPRVNLRSYKIAENALLFFNYNFNLLGYLPYFIPVVANYGRLHHDALGQKLEAGGQMSTLIERYHSDVERYKKQLLKGKIVHRHRDGFSNLLPEGFNVNKYKSIKINTQYMQKNKIAPYFMRLFSRRIKCWIKNLISIVRL